MLEREGWKGEGKGEDWWESFRMYGCVGMVATFEGISYVMRTRDIIVFMDGYFVLFGLDA